MRSLGERLNNLRRLISLRCGPGAAVLPAEVTKIHMDFARKINGGHMGAKKFWRENLPKLKFHNPAVPMIINRHWNQESDSFMTIYFRSAVADSAAAPAELSVMPESSYNNLAKAPPPGPNERVVRIDMKNKNSSVILNEFIAATQAVVLQPADEDVAELDSLETLRRKAIADRERVRATRAEKKREEEMLIRARAAGGATVEEAA
ncbi:hypothetical protein S7711_06568 [Stachybotrys chartarum IBT 7711]|uniref:Ribosomal protein/NADH dehydrogenase domain-containing protein n=1 Tax=Stachybotrys chartarum (strain CBS 109288 / IBT 7711) TaxID=1280523 RepID=A0A084AYM1_STACB|nr:hypothetical protein S7711_06568 [Stachybotrys chartarum IBT 7711]KFA50259.1 hypothetical protein S40293_03351 [Stachybotrys chartarum IBT 40293]KFA78320.1 hypothetical protein S40288_05005 [Stachybotrys chartarum IBT 40288]